jgi:predicted TIM-barrel fold metal-dependent hydrolase
MLRYLVTTYGAERLVIGSDYPLPAGLAPPIAEVKALELDPETESAVLGGNASRLLHLPT